MLPVCQPVGEQGLATVDSYRSSTTCIVAGFVVKPSALRWPAEAQTRRADRTWRQFCLWRPVWDSRDGYLLRDLLAKLGAIRAVMATKPICEVLSKPRRSGKSVR